MYLYLTHLLLAFCWAIFLLTFIKSMQYNNSKEAIIFGILSLFSMIAILIVGTKIMLNNPTIMQTGQWLHVKLSLDILLMLENIYLLKLLKQKKFISNKCGNIMYFLSLIAYMSMIILTLLKPF